jgi:hypothetical protein
MPPAPADGAAGVAPPSAVARAVEGLRAPQPDAVVAALALLRRALLEKKKQKQKRPASAGADKVQDGGDEAALGPAQVHAAEFFRLVAARGGGGGAGGQASSSSSNPLLEAWEVHGADKATARVVTHVLETSTLLIRACRPAASDAGVGSARGGRGQRAGGAGGGGAADGPVQRDRLGGAARSMARAMLQGRSGAILAILSSRGQERCVVAMLQLLTEVARLGAAQARDVLTQCAPPSLPPSLPPPLCVRHRGDTSISARCRAVAQGGLGCAGAGGAGAAPRSTGRRGGGGGANAREAGGDGRRRRRRQRRAKWRQRTQEQEGQAAVCGGGAGQVGVRAAGPRDAALRPCE